ncbi:hypothetical protein ACFQ6U_13765 [Streptomyces sp. NPDC056465]|uniref:hypothetical protein n=1 Tax=Streptomyces sp. NPDC056465 TaxID=3345829 RepID=UPI0036B78194
MNPPPLPLDDYPYAAHLATLDVVESIALCGSARQGISDAVSDLDLWIFVHNRTPLSEGYVIDHMLPADAQQEILFEGRDDSLVQHLVLNLVTGSRIVNLKILHTRVLTTFTASASPSLDPQFLEDLENYASMQLLHDPQDTLAGHLDRLRDRFVTTDPAWLTPLIAGRYASLYWRSVYQGLFRSEPASWRVMMGQMLELLAYQNAVNAGRLPTPAKWLLSSRIGLPNTVLLTEMQRAIITADATRQDHVLIVYQSLARVESVVWRQWDLPHGMWWRQVFFKRLPNLVRVTGNQDLAELLNGLPAEFRVQS